VANGFHPPVLRYASRRITGEFLDPYRPLLGPLNLSHLACLGLLAYGVVMIRQGGSTTGRPTARDAG